MLRGERVGIWGAWFCVQTSPPAAGFINDMCGTNLSRLLHVEFTV